MVNLDTNLFNMYGTDATYYNLRRFLHRIYDMEFLCGDLVGDILAYREKDKHIDSITIDMSQYRISVELTEDVLINNQGDMKSIAKYNQIINKIIYNINTIIINFINNLNYPELVNIARECGLLEEQTKVPMNFIIADHYVLLHTITFYL